MSVTFLTNEDKAILDGQINKNAQDIGALSKEIDNLKECGGSSSAVKTGEVLVIDDVFPEQHAVDVNLSSDSLSDFSDVTVIRSGKNLFGAAEVSSDKYNNISAVFNADGSVAVTNTSTVNKGAHFDFAIPWQKIAITVAEWPKIITIYKMIDDNPTLVSQFNAGETKVFDNSAGECSKLRITFFPDPGESVIRGIQAEIGTESTEYEIPNVQKYTANIDGTVDNVQSVSPTMVLFTDSDDVEIRAEYKAMSSNGDSSVSLDDIQPLIDEAKQEVIESIKPISKVSGGKMVVIGDSISVGVSSHYYPDSGSVVSAGSAGSLLTKNGNAWWQLVRDRYGITEDVINNSVTGASFARDGSVGNPRFTTYLNDTAIPADTDIIMIFGGTNDWGVNVPLGNLSDASDTSNAATFCAAVKAVIEYLTVHFADKQIVFITPMQRWFRAWKVVDGVREYTAADYDNDDASSIDNAFYNCRNGHGKYLYEYVNALKQLCADYGVAVVDLYAESRMYVHDEAFKMIYAPDGLHPNELGTKRYVENGIFPRLDQMWQYRLVDVE